MRFVDTNILVYAEQPGAGARHEAACAVLRDVWARRDGAVSAQVLQELFVTVTRKMPKPYTTEVARKIIANYLAWRVIPVDGELVLDAIDLQHEHQLSYWDSAIVAASVRAGASELLSEDLSDGQVIRGVRVRNPFFGVATR
jgi:predicted nucleic acid-binding protein